MKQVKLIKNNRKNLWIILSIAILIILIFLFNKTEDRGIVKIVNGESMEPTIKNGSYVVVNYDYYKKNKIERKDIVVIKFQTLKSEQVKRIIAIPGDKVLFGKDNNIYLNDKILNESYIKDVHFLQNDIYLILKQLEYYNYTLPKDYYLVMGDNRANSLDSTNYGLILKENIIGKIIKLNYTKK